MHADTLDAIEAAKCDQNGRTDTEPTPLPTTEGQTRPLSKLEPSQRGPAWQQAVAEASAQGKPAPTGKIVAEAVERITCRSRSLSNAVAVTGDVGSMPRARLCKLCFPSGSTEKSRCGLCDRQHWSAIAVSPTLWICHRCHARLADAGLVGGDRA